MADPFAAYVDPFAAYAAPYQGGKLAGHALSGDPGGYPEGEDPTQSVTSQIGRALQPLAHPQTVSDFGSLLLAPTDATRGALASIKPIGRGLGSVGQSVEAIGNDLPSKYSIPGAAALALQGHYKPAVAAAVIPPVIRGSGRVMQAMGKLMAGGSEVAPAAEGIRPVKASDFLDSLSELPKAERQAAMQTRIGSVADARAAGSQAFDVAPKPMLGQKAAVQPHPAHEPVPNVTETPIPTVNPDKPRISWPEAVENARRMHGSDEAARRLYGSGGAENKALVKAIAPGPSRTPYEAEGRFLDQRFRQLIEDPKAAWLLPLLAPQVREMLLSGMQSDSE